MTKQITTPYFPKALKYSTPLLFFASLYLFFNSHLFWGFLLITIGAVILTTNYVTKINLQDKNYQDYLACVGLELNKESKQFNMIEKMVITKGNHSQMVNTRSQSRQMDWTDYTATLIFDNNNTLDLLTRNDKKELITELKAFATILKIDIEDQTTKRYYWIDLNPE